eukprot:scaffold25771_cov39-Prasinocladus_malaysianus.AAC.1
MFVFGLAAGLSFHQIQSMCAAHRMATAINLSPCRHQLTHAYDFERAFTAVSRGCRVWPAYASHS